MLRIFLMKPGDDIIILVSNMGSMNDMELYDLAAEVEEQMS